jgi:hypothetical protein
MALLLLQLNQVKKAKDLCFNQISFMTSEAQWLPEIKVFMVRDPNRYTILSRYKPRSRFDSGVFYKMEVQDMQLTRTSFTIWIQITT